MSLTIVSETLGFCVTSSFGSALVFNRPLSVALPCAIPAPKKLMSINSIKRLAMLQVKINDGHKTTEMLIKSSKDKARQALEEALLVGAALIEAKQLIPYGGFEKWCQTKCSKISKMTVSKYIRLSQEVNHGLHLPATNLRKAYIELGIIDDPIDNETSATTSTATTSLDSPGPRVPLITTSTTQQSASTIGSKSNRKIIQATPTISTEDHLSRAKFLANELRDELNIKLINKLILKTDASKIIQPLLELVKE